MERAGKLTLGVMRQAADCFDTYRLDASLERAMSLEMLIRTSKGIYLASGDTALLNIPRRVPFVYNAPGGFVLGASHVIASAQKLTCIEGMIFNPKNDNKYYGAEAPGTLTADRNGLYYEYSDVVEQESEFFLGAHDNFGHWLYNNLCRLAYKNALSQLRELAVVVPESITPAQLECLEILGYPRDKLILTKRRTLYRFKDLWSSTTPWYSDYGNMHWWSHGNIDFLRSAFDVAAPRDVPLTRRLYISRRRARWRRVVNEDELLKVLTPLGYEVIFPETMTIREQIASAQSAESIAGPIGAGNNLFLFGQRHAVMLELRPPIIEMLLTGHICRQIGQTFVEHVGVPKPAKGQNDIDADFLVDPAEVGRLLQKALAAGTVTPPAAAATSP